MSEHLDDDPAELEQLASSGLFDADWYLLQYDDVRQGALQPLLHFYRHGWRENRKPNQYFDPEWYLEQYDDVRGAGMNPLLHYVRHGEHEGRRPIRHFDPAWYRAAYELPSDAIALAHFLTQRTTGRFAPVPELYAVLHLSPYRDDPASGEDPFAHYLDDMLREHREPFPDLQIVAASGLLDPNYYLINGTDVYEAALDPAEHFCRYGWREPRKPNIYFDINWYLHTNPGVARLRINPVMHYILEGEMAGRRPVPYFDPPWYRQTYAIEPGQNALAHFLAHRRSQRFSPTPLFDVAWYVAQHPDEMGPNRDPFAHYLQAGTFRDLNPSPAFNAAEYRKRTVGRPSRQFRQLMHPDRDNPLLHYLRANYR
ncbi:MAG TPA: hypothetical protein VKT26_09950 [Acetobacteraceae bacterium]|nr:hypothetical protein [Acetobacteraceae bacterium]